MSCSLYRRLPRHYHGHVSKSLLIFSHHFTTTGSSTNTSSSCTSSSGRLPIQVTLDDAKTKHSTHLFCNQYQTQQLNLQYSNGVNSKSTKANIVIGGILTSSSFSTPFLSVRRYFGSKAGKMGKHLQNLDEMAHEKYRKNKKSNKKQQQQGPETNNESSTSHPASEAIPDITLHHQPEDENETKFDHGGGIDESPNLPTKQDVKQRMMKVVQAMEDSFRSIRGAEASPELFDSVQVKAYGSMTPLNVLAQVVISSPTMATITCFDPETTNAVRDAVRDMAGMNFNPRIEEGTIVVPIPRVSMETRKAIVKQVGKVAEMTRQRVRRIRRAAQDVVKLGKDGKLGPGISEDDAFRAAKEIDAVTEECIKALNEIVEKKQESILTV